MNAMLDDAEERRGEPRRSDPFTAVILEQQEYELAINELDRPVRIYSTWDWVQDELARFAATAQPEVLNRARGQLPRLGILARGLLRYPRNANRKGVRYRRKAPSPNELRHLLLLRIVMRCHMMPARRETLTPKHVYVLFDRAGVERPDRERVRHAIRKVVNLA
jgi:hypothetical protein